MTTPHIAAELFYRHLAQVPGWEALPVTVAAQRVQRSAAPTAYAQWEAEARVLAVALTGESGAGLTCRFDAPSHPVTATTTGPALRTALADEVGLPGPGDALDPGAGVDGRELAGGPRRPVRHRPGQLRRASLDGGDGGVARADPLADARVRY